MKSPALVAFASFIPGLGLWLVGKRRQAVLAAIFIFGFLWISFFARGETLAGFSHNVAVFLWLIQGIYAVYEARLAEAIQSGELQPAKELAPLAPAPSDLGLYEKAAFKTKDLVQQQLEIGEHVLDAIPAHHTSAMEGPASYRLYYIGLLQDKLAIINTDFLGKPAGIERLAFSFIENIAVKHGLLQDRLIVMSNYRKPLEVKVTRRLRAHTDNFVSTFMKQKSHPA